jgi:hypothetical protein
MTGDVFFEIKFLKIDRKKWSPLCIHLGTNHGGSRSSISKGIQKMIGGDMVPYTDWTDLLSWL